MRSLLPLALVACAPEPPAEAEPFDPALAQALEGGLDAIWRDAGAPGAVAGVRLPDGAVWIGSFGEADAEADRDTAPDDRYRLGSITKTFTASVVLQLDAEGALDLDDPIALWVPAAPYGDRITLRMLLAHASGLDDYVDRLEFLGNPTADWAPEALIALVADDPLLFEPGTGYSYSNAGYVLLGMAIEAASGESWATHVHDRYLAPRWLFDIGIPSADLGDDTDVVGYVGGNPSDPSIYNPAAAWSAGEMVSDANDLLAWSHALYTGEVLGAALTADMTTRWEYPDGEHSNYGLGCQIRRVAGRDTVGHNGSSLGFNTDMRHDVATGLDTVVFVNDFTGDADVIEAALWRLLADEGVFDE